MTLLAVPKCLPSITVDACASPHEPSKSATRGSRKSAEELTPRESRGWNIVCCEFWKSNGSDHSHIDPLREGGPLEFAVGMQHHSRIWIATLDKQICLSIES